MMKFQIVPSQLGQIVRLCESASADEYIVASLEESSGVSIECVKLRDLQRNTLTPDKIVKHQFDISSLTVIADNLEKYVASWNNQVSRPHSLKAYFIENLDDVRQYLRDIHLIYDCEFHPDDDFDNFTNENDVQTFSTDEAKYLNFIMIQCFDICDKQNVEIYDIAGEVQVEIWKKKGMWPINPES